MNDNDQKSQPAGEASPAFGCSAFERAARLDPIISDGMRRSVPLSQIIIAMHSRHEYMMTRLMALEAIAPRKITMPNGDVLVYRCPVELLPDVPSLPNR